MGRWLKRLAFRTLFLTAVLLALFLSFRGKYRNIVSELAVTQVKNTTSDLTNDAIAKQIAAGNIQYDRIVFFEKDLDGRITALKTNMSEVNRLKTDILNIINDEILAADPTDFFHNFQSQLQSAVDIAAVFVATLVVKRGEEAAQQAVGVGCVDFNTVTACGLYPLCGLTELTDQNHDLFLGDWTGSGLCIIRSHMGGGDQLRCAGYGECHVCRVE